MNKITKCRCQDCEFYYVHNVPELMKKRGIVLYYRQWYCFFGKRIRQFSDRDPKISVPKWCERQLKPPVLRIYEFKDAVSRSLYYMFGGDLAIESRYKLCCEEPCQVSLNKLLEEKRSKINEHFIETGEVIEFDDGIRQLFFLETDNGLEQVSFDKPRIGEIK